LSKIKLLYENNKEKVKTVSKINPVIAEILYNRGFRTEKDMQDFIEKKEKNYGELKGIKEAARIIGDSVNHETIVLYSDTDVDGCMSAVVGMKLLKEVTDKVYFYTNDKYRDGYGLCKTGVDNILKLYPETKLIITADNGVAAMEIDYAKEKGLKVVVTDHHEPPEILPPADVIVDAKQKDCPYKFKELCGAGVLYKVLKETYKYLGINEDKADMVLDLVAVATVGDAVPLIEENRIIVDKGLKMINTNKSPVFTAIKEVLGIKEIDANNIIAYHIAPMINALSRMTGSINKGIELFLTDDKEKIREILAFMKEKNEERKELTEIVLEQCKASLPSPLTDRVIVVGGENFHEGVVGIAAGKLKEEFNRPAIVLTTIDEEKKILRGSARSIEKFPLKENFDKIQRETGIFETYGGHKKAAGLSIKRENLGKLRELLNKEAERILNSEDIEKKVVIDASITTKDLSVELVEDIENLGPFGEGFPEPVIGINFSYTDIYKMGDKKQHLKFLDKFTDTSVIMWNGSKALDNLKTFKRKAVGTLSINSFRDKKSAQLIVNDGLLF
jgi:single-stranded-DNA-specific exonuclease